MERADLRELHYITPIENLPSIMARGLLSNRRSRRHRPASLALEAVQDRRAGKRVPGGLPLHDYVNLYVCARNPMLYKRLDRRHEMCVLAVSTHVLDLDGVVVTDQNAASSYVRFGAGAAGLANVNRERTFAEYWTHEDPVEGWRRKSAKCAEVLVPHRLDPDYIERAYVCGAAPRRAIEALGLDLDITDNAALFFGRV